MRIFNRIAAIATVAAVLASCAGKNTVISGVLADGAGKQLAVKLLDVNRYQLLDSVKANASGAFSYQLNLKDARPEFIYLFYGDRQIASLLLQKGDHVMVRTDTLGAYSVEGSPETLKLQQVENDYNAVIREMSRIIERESNPDASLNRAYVKYYRDRVKYVMNNPRSLTVVPVFFQQLNDGLPVFGQATDGILMRNVCDSLKTVYPESRYVKALEAEVQKRLGQLEVNNRLKDAEEVSFIDIDLPGLDGKNRKLSEAVSKVTMLYFWSSTAAQKMYNLDGLVPLYDEFKGKGFEIYSVALDTDKSAWASVVRNQKLPWVNVCDTRADQSPYVSLYGVSDVPMAWFLVDGELDPSANVSSAADIRAYLRKKL
ncbi:MAG: TlpA family protein disulfide reductase [Bacteroidales bacterium]|nr:TlpA family protein disulfide reductase [Bacteroidales bacterium]